MPAATRGGLHGLLRVLLLIAMVTPVGLSLAACDEDGPAEEAGEKIDDAVEKAGKQIEDATD